MRAIKMFINWFSPSLEDTNGTASYRRLSALVFIGLIMYMVIADTIKDQIHLYAFYALLTTFLLLVAVVTLDSITNALASLKYGNRGNYDPPEKKDPVITTTTEIKPQS